MRIIGMKWSTLVYNFRWSDWTNFIDGWIPKFALMVPIIGYLLLFNDEIASVFDFETLTSQDAGGLSALARLRFVYFGLIFLGVSNFLYRWKKPRVHRFGNNIVDFTKTCLETLSFQGFLEWHNINRTEGSCTPDGKYYDSEWNGFAEAANNEGEGTDTVVRNGNWEQAKSMYGSLLRSLLRETFFRYDRRNRIWLSLCLCLSTLGYLSLLLPSLDIFLKVLRSVIQM